MTGKITNRSLRFAAAVLWLWGWAGAGGGAALFPAGAEENAVCRDLYLGARFSQVIRYIEEKDPRQLSLEEKSLFIECLARTGKGSPAQEKLRPLLESHPCDPGVLAAAGAAALSLGRLEEAKKHIHRALQQEPTHKRALLANVLLSLYRREFDDAREDYEKLVTSGKSPANPWADSDLLFLVGVDVYRANRDPKKLAQLHRTQAAKNKKTDKDRYQNANADYRMYKRAAKRNGTLFRVETPSDSAAVPFNRAKTGSRFNTLSITAGGKTFTVLLDTGNAAGWLVHSRELNERLKPVTGGRTITMIGTESGFLDGYRQYYKTLDFKGFTLRHVNGIYVPKPHPDFPDANLNPAFIQNRVVTFDFIKNRLVLRTKGRFARDTASVQQGEGAGRMPWYGYKFVLVPVTVTGGKENEKKGLAIIETGAEDIALKLDFIRGQGLPLQPRVKYLATGQVSRYHQTPVTLLLGGTRFRREAADVWPFSRFYNRLTGLSADVVMGPTAFKGKYTVSFDPFNNHVLLEEGSLRRPCRGPNF